MTGPLVLAPLNGTKHALCALPIARRLADLDKAPVRILHVTEETRTLGKTAEWLGLSPADLRGATLEVRSEDPAEAILAAAADCAASLIVMCAHTADVPPDGGLGATARAVLCGAGCPVVLVDPARATGDWRLRRMLAPHDGSPGVSEALGPAVRLVREAGAELVVLQVADGARALEAGSLAPPAYMDQVQHSWPVWSGEFLQRLASICPLADVQVRLVVRHGEPADETLRVAGEESADLIVLPWKGHWEAPHAATLKAVLRAAPCPVMVTRAAPPEH